MSNALYNSDLIGQSKAISKPTYWVAVKLGDRNAVVVIDLTETKDNHEIVGWRLIDEKGFEKMKKQAKKEGGQFLITKSDNAQGAADRNISALHSGLYINIIDNSSENVNEPQFSIRSERQEFEEYLNREEAKQNDGSNVVQLSDWETYEKGVEEGKRLGREEKRTADRLAKIARNREKGRQYLAQQEQINKALEEARKPKPATFANKVEAIENWFALKFANKRQRLVEFQDTIEKALGHKLADYMNPHRQLDTIDGRIQYRTEAFNNSFLMVRKLTY